MSWAAYYREQARICRDFAAQLTFPQDAIRLREMAESYEAEAEALEGVRAGTETTARVKSPGSES